MMNDRSAGDDPDRIHEAEEFYASFFKEVRFLFARIATVDKWGIRTITERVRTVWETMRYNRRFLMHVLHHAEPASDKNYLVSHSVRATVVAMIIGNYLKLPHHRLNELGIATLFHDIGMLSLPPELYLSGRALTAEEKKVLYLHPVHSYKLLQRLECPPAICLGALEHHEREDGSGYPRNFKGNRISLYGKIIAVACSYEALSAKRSHKEAKDTHTGILELLKNEGKRYDDAVVRALVYSLSIYPIGLHVLLSNGQKGQVVDVNPVNPRYPIVQLLEPTQEGKKTTYNTLHDGVSITRPLTHEERIQGKAG